MPPHTPGVLYGCETKGVAGRGICKNMKTRAIKIDGSRTHTGLGKKEEMKRVHCQQNLVLDISASVTICQVRN